MRIQVSEETTVVDARSDIWSLAGGHPVRVLLVEAAAGPVQPTRDLLQIAPHVRFVIDWARDLQTGMARLRAGGFDVCLVDHTLPDGDGLELVRAAQTGGCRAPILLLSAAGTLDLDLQAMALGVADFLDKRWLDPLRLERTIRYALARQDQAERLSRLAQYDELTGLANRSLFQDRLERALAWARRQQRLVGVMILDLNGFKAINDRLGHLAGDRLLAVMAKRLGGRLRETDTVARLGGDEFAILIENLAKPEHAALVARKLLDTVAPPATIDGREVAVTASLGVALYPRDGQTGAELVRQADRAMYRAKAEGGNLCRFSSDQLERRVQRGALLETDLRRGLEQGEFQLHYQPQVTLTPGALGISALIRWCHPQLGLIGPERFLLLAEDTGLLEALTSWLFEAACGQARRWHDQGLDRVHLALPLLSRQQLAWSGLTERLGVCLRAAGLAAGSLEIELSEELLLNAADGGGGALDRPEGARRAPRARWLRPRPDLAARPAARRPRHPEARPRAAPGRAGRCPARRRGRGDHRAGARARAAGGGRRRRSPGAARLSAPARLRCGPGVHELPAAAGRGLHQLAAPGVRAARRPSRSGARPDRCGAGRSRARNRRRRPARPPATRSRARRESR